MQSNKGKRQSQSWHFALAESGGQMAENGGWKPSETAFSKKIIP